MKKFLVTYLAPASVIDDWKKTEPEKRKEAEEKMQGEWKKWMSDHTTMFVDKGAGVGKTKCVTAQGTSDTKNDIMLYAIGGRVTRSGGKDIRRPPPLADPAILHRSHGDSSVVSPVSSVLQRDYSRRPRGSSAEIDGPPSEWRALIDVRPTLL